MFRHVLLGCVAATALAVSAAPAVAGKFHNTTKETPDLVLYDGAIFTADKVHPRAQAIAIDGERILAVGSDASVRKLAGPKTRQIDLKGHTVIPGFNDAHAHLGIWPANQINLDQDNYDPAWNDLKDMLAKAVAKAPKGAPISATIGTTVFYDTSVDRTALDAVAPDNPVYLGTFDGHAMIMNSAALKAVGLTDAIKDPVGGRYERSADGHINGVIREYAASVNVSRMMGAAVSDDDAKAALKAQLTEALHDGITSVQDMPTSDSPERTVALLKQISTPVRVRVTRMNRTTETGRDKVEGLDIPASPAPLITANGTKWILDGVIFEGSLTPRGEGVTKSGVAGSPYSFSGLPVLFSPPEVEAMLRETLKDKRQLQVHVFGTPAATEMLDAMDATGGAKVWLGKRVRFEHGDGLTPALITRAKAMGIVVSQQGDHMGIVQIEPKLGDAFQAQLKAENAQPLKSLLAADIPLALGSDGPLNPFMGIMFATLHPDRPEEAISREEAVTAYTLGSAYAEFAEKDKGSLEPGKLADIAVLSQDIFTVAPPDLMKTTAVITIVDGKIAWDAGAL